MMQLTLAFYAESEGETDERFLPVIIQRTTQQIFPSIDVLEPIVISLKTFQPDISSREQYILRAAKSAFGLHALVIHCDADGPTSEKAFNERYKPGYELVEKTKNLKNGLVCELLIPVIPVQMLEAWMLADEQILLKVIGTDLKATDLGLPIKIKEVESYSDPKMLLKEAMRKAYSSRTRRKRIKSNEIGLLYEPLARQIRLEKLEQVPSFRKFAEDLKNALNTLGGIR